MRAALCIFVFLVCLAMIVGTGTVGNSQARGPDSGGGAGGPVDILAVQGKIVALRVNDVGIPFGPPTDFIDGEVIVRVDTRPPSEAYGFQLRDDGFRWARQGMLDLLRDAFNNNWTVDMSYAIERGKTKGIILQVTLLK